MSYLILNDERYYQLLSELIEHSLLHLYFKISATTRFTPVQRRNDILVKFIKDKGCEARYKPLKTEIKRMVLLGRNKSGDLERRLVDLNQMAMKLSHDVNHLQRLFDLLHHLENEHNYRSQLCKKNETPIVDVIYLLQDHIEYCFNTEGDQIAPVSILFESENSGSLVDIINQTGLFIAEMKEMNVDQQQAHILLHPKESSSEIAA
ncbi:DUF2913 family protein [Photobacterium piscicola]|uniref:DUF2913 family protein n=1 Tax=Photobacterium piscicola TaxID=1378299 RepID=UPI003736CD51